MAHSLLLVLLSALVLLTVHSLGYKSSFDHTRQHLANTNQNIKHFNYANRFSSNIILRCESSKNDDTIATADIQIDPNETPEEKYKREKLAEIAERKAKEVFVTRTTGKFECQACGYVYSEAQGYEKRGIAPNTPFDEIENFRCPQCGANKKYFVAETETISGFKENLKFGLGLTRSQADRSKILFLVDSLHFLLFSCRGICWNRPVNQWNRHKK